MTPQLKAVFYYAALMTAMLGCIFGAGALSIYASGVSSSISRSYLNKSMTIHDDKNSLIQVRKQNLLEAFSSPGQKFHFVKQDYSGTSAFLYVITDSKGKPVKTIVIKKIGISAFSPYISDTTLYAKPDPAQRNLNPILNALNVRAKSLQQQIEAFIMSGRSGKQ